MGRASGSSSGTSFSELPDEVLSCHVLNCLDSGDLCSLMAVSNRLRAVQMVREKHLGLFLAHITGHTRHHPRSLEP